MIYPKAKICVPNSSSCQLLQLTSKP